MTAHALTLAHVTVDVQRRCVEGRRLGQLRVLEDCSLHVPAGEALALVGPAACGKSTVLDLFAGFTRPVSGLVDVGGSPVAGPAPERGFVQPSYGLFPWRTALQNVRFAAGDKGVRHGSDVLDLVGLVALADQLVGELTAAQKQRVAVAKALVHDPGVLLLDDPFAQLEPVDRVLLRDDLAHVQREADVTLILATSSIEDAVRVGTQVAVLSPAPGRIETVIDVEPAQHLAAAHAVWSALHQPPALSKAA